LVRMAVVKKVPVSALDDAGSLFRRKLDSTVPQRELLLIAKLGRGR
jgi:hypothetical protein